ncbi:2-amino-4-hydroxy-6-hydroxymethyldihydropteridine diphosphokinase [Parabacteroides sp. PF5-5]|uniref:2-amino-4-hydroxy-6- hydroxymethyldihydropteridine diphosphokinase n=1 Tax=unclassified Parabacteroides TaxID=2649774 RepID=UPI00247615E5|nr:MULTISPECIES: 2-amino-4-hydroxy-6-hydroxymethyldihydropteridine diphosphokinase [unclassified Parabacteroides]MDH6306624.1 2-amino-4-hydroxy-6-hydroxymethyldihydropteridine diphosphokinase [Parabacteroides sp. PH5-39]MDH6317591.1 2-amino-4-hydroxy-6-hydroxymethyldihydropteridine diphosphokinase [Parabacteroides sp. PF5-13]MDH6321335.1 2-amino-4-hydroxy-6-hydroxymethyldihydropteridine diphosphokinase [Parabacteroides sp. PH5-13]MDH6325100.1 2-amino-4-hydroxy-6-hydroxymethyldihydropteridine di
MAKVYLSLGTNLGDKKRNLITVSGLLAERVGTILALSTMYETKPWGFESENTFLNAAIILETSYPPFELLEITQKIELEMGRKEKSNGSYKDRIIDIDILMYEDLIVTTEKLTIPHPFMHKRSFVIGPLAEIAASLVHPVLKKTIGELYLSLPAL